MQAHEKVRGLIEQLEELLDELRQAVSALAQEATVDPLTGLRNRRYLMQVWDEEIARTRQNMAVVFVFLSGNGRSTDGGMLRDLGELLLAQARRMDTVVYDGAGAFIILVPEASSREASVHETRFAEVLANHGYGEETLGTVRVAAVSFPEDGDTIDELMGRASHGSAASEGQGALGPEVILGFSSDGNHPASYWSEGRAVAIRQVIERQSSEDGERLLVETDEGRRELICRSQHWYAVS